MRHTLLLVVGIAFMAVLGYLAATRNQDMVWLLVPGFAILIAIVSLTKIFR